LYGIDTPTSNELIASTHSVQEICEYLCADSLAYLSQDGMMRVAQMGEQQYCSACFTGAYPVRVSWQDELQQLALFDKESLRR
jgi:amidophosphoribosyltransferase